jgi:hypothetical protein
MIEGTVRPLAVMGLQSDITAYVLRLTIFLASMGI